MKTNWLLMLVAVVQLGSFASLHAAELRYASFVQPLAQTTDVIVIASDISVAGDEFKVRHDNIDVSAAVIAESTVLTATDADQDDIYETYSRRHTLDLRSIALGDPRVVVEATTRDAQGVPTTSHRTITMTTPATLGTSDTGWVTAEHGSVAAFYLHIKGVKLQSTSVSVWCNGVDVTASANTTESILWEETLDGMVRDRLVRIEVDLQSIGFGQVGDELQLSAELVALLPDSVEYAFGVSSPVIREVSATAEQVKCDKIRTCLAAFVIAAQVSTAGGKTTIGASPAEVAGAADDLESCLKAAGMTAMDKKTVSVAGFGTVNVGLGMAGAGADLVIAIGADGTNGNAGGNAMATNSQTGGAAIAVGGDGAAGGQTGGGTATSSAKGGDCMAVGGNGGSGSTGGGNGGSATGTNGQPGATTTAKGGDGGAPGGGASGGSGGSGTVTLRGTSTGPGGIGSPTVSGTGGSAIGTPNGVTTGTPGEPQS